MLDLHFQIVGARPERAAAGPVVLFRLRVAGLPTPAAPPTVVHSAVLHCVVQSKPARLPGTGVTLVVRPFTGCAFVDLPVPCGDLGAGAREGEDVPLCFRFSGTIFHDDGDGLQVTSLPGDTEVHFRLRAATWLALAEPDHPGSASPLGRSDVFGQPADPTSRRGLPVEEEPVSS